jgi:hypothetical protein
MPWPFTSILHCVFFSSNVRLLKPDVGDLPEQSLGAGANDVLISISFRRYTQLTIEWSRKLKDKGVTVVSVTDSMLSPLSHGADIPLISPTSIPSFFESYTGQMGVLKTSFSPPWPWNTKVAPCMPWNKQNRHWRTLIHIFQNSFVTVLDKTTRRRTLCADL